MTQVTFFFFKINFLPPTISKQTSCNSLISVDPAAPRHWRGLGEILGVSALPVFPRPPSQLVSYLPFTSFMLHHHCRLCKRMLGMARGEGSVWVYWACCGWFGERAEGLPRREDQNQWCWSSQAQHLKLPQVEYFLAIVRRWWQHWLWASFLLAGWPYLKPSQLRQC